jgi:hypothetical protein
VWNNGQQSWDCAGNLDAYYRSTYAEIRGYDWEESQNFLVITNDFWGHEFPADMQAPAYRNLAKDMHKYIKWCKFSNWSDCRSTATCLQCIQDIDETTKEDQGGKMVNGQYKPGYPTFIGEWSFGGYDNWWDLNQRKQVQDAYITAVTQGIGFYFWSWRADSSSDHKWSFEKLIDEGWAPIPADKSDVCNVDTPSWS